MKCVCVLTVLSLGLELQSRPQSYCWLCVGLAGKPTTRYAQIDITATETAHKVGTQHALGRQEGLHTLELRKKGTQH